MDIGLKSSEGFFAKIARSGRIEFSRKESTSWGEPECETDADCQPPAEECYPCATSSCPVCSDCVAACIQGTLF